MKSRLVRRLAVLLVSVAAMLSVASPAWAETFTVTNTNDSGPGSLLQAIAAANDTDAADTITFAPSARGTITLTETLRVGRDLTIEGPGAEALTISGNYMVRPLDMSSIRLDLSGVTIANGRARGVDPLLIFEDVQNHGGAISNTGTLTIRKSVLSNNRAVNRGGAIFNFGGGKVNMFDSTLSDNSAELGGAIHNLAVTVFGQQRIPQATVVGSILRKNYAGRGGALYNEGIVRLTDSTLNDNHASSQGGGVYTALDLAVQRSTVSGNTSNKGGGLYESAGAMKVDDSAFYGNYGDSYGGIGIAGGSATVTNSTLSANETGDNGGSAIGIEGGNATITNSTISGNRALYGGGPGGVWGRGTAATALTIRGTIVAGNTATDGNPDVEGNYTNDGFNIVGGTADEAGLQTDAQGSPVLADNGGPTQTVALVRGSKAIDKGNSFGSTTDQRGEARPKDYASTDNAQGGDGSDVGAFEYVYPDATAPAVEARPSPPPDAGGLNNSDVTVAMNAADEAGGSGVWRVSYSASGAQPVSEQNVSGNSAELVVSAEGETVMTYWATDRAGNRSESKTLTVRLDKTPPETSIGSGPSGPTKGASASFGFSSTEEGSKFECSLDSGAFEACSSPRNYSALTDGGHALEVRATDGAGNTDPTPARRTWSVDTASPDTAIASGPSGSVRSASASFRFSSAEAGATFECKLDRGTFAPCASPKSYSALANGGHTFSVRAKDGAGNPDPTPAVRTWTVDAARPTISGVSTKIESTNGNLKLTIRATVRDNLTNLQKANVKLYVNGGPISPTKYSYNSSTDALVYNPPNVARGKKTVKIVATDAAGNAATKSWSFTIR